MMCQSIGMPPISTIGLGRTVVSSLRREPKPPARMTAFIRGESSPSGSGGTSRPGCRSKGAAASLEPFMDRKKLISVVIPAYNEEDCVDELARRLQGVFDSLPQYDFEVIIVENGSVDATWEQLHAIHARDARFKIVRLARNFRMDGGLTAGLAHAKGDAAVLMTADLQDPPELIPQFLAKWEEGYENVYGVVTARTRHGPDPPPQLQPLLPGRRQAHRRSHPAQRDATSGSSTARSYDTINTMEERNRFVRGLFAWVGFKSIGIEHEREQRFAGVSNAHTFERHRPRVQGASSPTPTFRCVITLRRRHRAVGALGRGHRRARGYGPPLRRAVPGIRHAR